MGGTFDLLKIDFPKNARIFRTLRTPGRPPGPHKIDFGGREKLGVYRHDTRAFGADPPFFLKKLGVYRHARAPSAHTLHFVHHFGFWASGGGF